VALKPGAFRPDEEHMGLIRKVMAGKASDEERERFGKIHFERSCRLLETPAEDLFNITAVEMKLPPRARIESSEPCASCGEPTMPSKMETANGRRVCRGCL
jgi:formylmethanofuran dehydrogenase subunit E